MLLIILVNAIAIAACVVLYIVAKAGIQHYMDLYQNVKDTKNLRIIVLSALIAAILGSVISCTLMFKEYGYNTSNKTEVENVIRR